MVDVERDSCWKLWRGVDLYAFVAHDGEMVFRALFRQRGGGGDVIVIVLAVANRTMLQQIVAPNNTDIICRCGKTSEKRHCKQMHSYLEGL